MKVSLPRDLTKGHPLPVIVLYAVPMLISMFFQQAYNLVDGWIAGTQIGSVALGAVGTCYPVTVFFLAIASGLSLGTSIFCSLEFGGGRYGRVRTAMTTSLLAFLPLSVVLSGAGLLLVPRILQWLAIPAQAVSATRDYLVIYLLGLPFLFLYNLSSSILTGLGDSRTPLKFLIISCTCNIVLDYLFVKAVPWGVRGLAFATLLSQAAASLFGLPAVLRTWRFLKREERESPGPERRFSLPVLGEVLKLGIPSMVQHLFMSTGQLSLQSVINGYDTAVMAGYSVAFRMNGIVINSLMSLSNALSGFMAQNLGAGAHGRVRQGVRICLVMSLLFSAAVAAVFVLGGEGILSFFVKEEENRQAVIAAGVGFLRVVSPFYLLVCVKITSDGALRGIGAMTPFMAATMSDVVVRILCGRPFSDRWGINGVWAVWPTAWLVGTAMSVGFYLVLSRKKMGREDRSPEPR